MKLIYGVKDKPKFGQTILFALQQLLAILAATIAVPAIVGHGMSQSAALFGAGVGTLVYLLFTKFKSPVFLGSSFAFLGSMAAAFAGGISASAGYLGLLIGAACAGLVYIILAVIVKFAGVKWIKKLMPAVVIGPVVAIIGLSLAGNAVGDLTAVKKDTYYDPDDYRIYTVASDDYVFDKETGEIAFGESYILAKKEATAADAKDLKKDDVVSGITVQKVEAKNDDGTVKKDEAGKTVYTYVLSSKNGSPYIALICGLVTLVVTMLCATYGKKTFRMIPFIIGILAGYATAAIFTLIGTLSGNAALEIIDFSLFQHMKWLPDFTFLTAFGGKYDFGDFGSFATYLGTVAVAYVPVAFVVFAEHIADHKNISTIIEHDLLEDPGLHRTLLGDGVGSIAGAFFGGCPNTTYGESIGCVAISGNASVVTILTAAVLAILAAFAAPFTTFLATIPSCVMGGVCIALYGFIAVSGLKMIKNVDLGENHNLFVVSVILIAGVGGLVLTFGKVTLTSVACALILGILTNLILGAKKKDGKDGKDPANEELSPAFGEDESRSSAENAEE